MSRWSKFAAVSYSKPAITQRNGGVFSKTALRQHPSYNIKSLWNDDPFETIVTKNMVGKRLGPLSTDDPLIIYAWHGLLKHTYIHTYIYWIVVSSCEIVIYCAPTTHLVSMVPFHIPCPKDNACYSKIITICEFSEEV